jgi:hypothetical protein
MRISSNLDRRRALLLAAVPASGVLAGAALGLPFGDRRVLEGLARELGMLRPEFRRLAQRVRLDVVLAQVAGRLLDATRRLRTVVGTALYTAKATVPALIEDDFSFGRTVEVQGVIFSHTELALLLVVGDMAAAPAAS